MPLRTLIAGGFNSTFNDNNNIVCCLLLYDIFKYLPILFQKDPIYLRNTINNHYDNKNPSYFESDIEKPLQIHLELSE